VNAYLDVWHARIVGRLQPETLPGSGSALSGALQITVEFAGEPPTKFTFDSTDLRIAGLEFEVRIYHLRHRQAYGLRVEEVRNYLNRYGGVHVYDAGFHLPYYGSDTDWLRIEQDHAHRLSRSQLLPEEMQIPEGLNFLPTNSRILGIVNVDTSRERSLWDPKSELMAGDFLRIQISRDRLVDNSAFRQLIRLVRTAIDAYAEEEAKRVALVSESERPVKLPVEYQDRAESLIEEIREQIPSGTYTELRSSVAALGAASRTQSEVLARQVGLLGALATAGITAVAFEHELAQQYSVLENLVERLESLAAKTPQAGEAAVDLRKWLTQARATRELFRPIMNQEDRAAVQRYRARALIDELAERMKPLLRGAKLGTDNVGSELRLPAATYAEWSAVFQNLITNSVNAMLDSERKLIQIGASVTGTLTRLKVEDTGVGVNLADSETFFQPFVRRSRVSPERRALGIGGTGLGLTIVRLILQQIGARVAFVVPSEGFATAVEIDWEEVH
jgi:signal transduction histidine kinase